jgi:PAS domain S-box-containing protein
MARALTNDPSDFRRYADDLPLFVWLQDAGGGVDWTNRAWYEYTRLPEDIATSAEGWAKVVHPDDLPSAMRVFGGSVATGGHYEFEFRLKPAGEGDSAYRWMLARSTPRFESGGTLTHWLGTGIDIHDAKMLAEHATESFRVMGDVVPQMMWSARPDGWIDWYNQRWYDYTGQSREDAAGWGWQAVHHPDDLAKVMNAWAASIASGSAFEMEFRLRGADGAFRWFLTRAVPRFADDCSVLRWYGTNTDIDGDRRQRARDAFFARVGDALASALSLEETLRAVTHLVVPEFTDWALVNLLDADDRIRLAETYHRDPEKHAAAMTLLGVQYGRVNSDSGSAAVVRTGRPRFHPIVTGAGLAATIDGDVLDTVMTIGVGSSIIVPMLYRGKAVGTLSVVRTPGGESYGAADVPFFEQLAARIAPAIGNAASYERERRIAQTFQRAAMNDALPDVPGLVFDAIYEAGKAEAQVGGDWYDAFKLGDGRIVLSVGDVAGSGLEAAVTMSNVRQSIRTAALINPDPIAVLEAVDRAVRAMTDRFVTAFVGVLDPVHLDLCYASAGHPPALLRKPDRTVALLEHGSLPLGLRQRSAQRSSVASLEPGSIVVLYTDGLTEIGRDAIAGEAAVVEAIGTITESGRAAQSIFRAIMREEAPHDDVAILTVTIEAGPQQHHVSRWSFDSRDARAARAIRADFAARLRAAGLSDGEVDNAELIFSELVGNVVRYAVGEVRISLDATADMPVLHVLDGGAGFEHNSRLPSDPMQENGRGLFIICSIADDFTISRRPDGGSHARAVIAGRIRRRDAVRALL